MPPKPVNISGVGKFESQTAFRKYLTDIYNKVGECDDIKREYPEEYRILIECIKQRHPNQDEKLRGMKLLKIMSVCIKLCVHID